MQLVRQMAISFLHPSSFILHPSSFILSAIRLAVAE
jgi:hypothetical protein